MLYDRDNNNGSALYCVIKAFNLTAVLEYKNNEYETAVKLLDKAINFMQEIEMTSNEKVAIFYNKARALHKLNDYQNAIALYAEVLSLEPEHAKANLYKSEIDNSKSSNNKSSIGKEEQSSKESYEEALFKEAEMLHQSKNENDKRAAYNKYCEILRIVPKDSELYYQALTPKINLQFSLGINGNDELGIFSGLPQYTNSNENNSLKYGGLNPIYEDDN